MFSFHKPKVYRSTQGCCICKAKSSSSRFTDSKKYETDFIECFQLKEPRQGEICNACVLLVKRYKRLPPGNSRNWGHVVDARVGPGLKSMTKFKKRKEEQLLRQQNGIALDGADNIGFSNNATNGGANGTSIPKSTNSSVSERFGKIFKKTKKKIIENNLHIIVPRSGTPGSSDDNSFPSSPSPNNSDIDDNIKCMSTDFVYEHENRPTVVIKHIKSTRKTLKPMKNRNSNRTVADIAATIVESVGWKYVKTCCGGAYVNEAMKSILYDCEKLNRCDLHRTSTWMLNRINTNENMNANTINHGAKNTVFSSKNSMQPNMDSFSKNVVMTLNSLILSSSSSTSTTTTATTGAALTKKQHLLMKHHQQQQQEQQQHTPISSNHFELQSPQILPNNVKKTEDVLKPSAAIQSKLVHQNDTTKNQEQFMHSIANNAKLNKLISSSVPSSSVNILEDVVKDRNAIRDSGKIVKKVCVIGPTKSTKCGEMMKTIVKLCAPEKSAKSKASVVAAATGSTTTILQRNVPAKAIDKNLALIESMGHKFSDNSSDSGYDDISHQDKSQGSHSVNITGLRPIYIATNGLKFQIQSNNRTGTANQQVHLLVNNTNSIDKGLVNAEHKIRSKLQLPAAATVQHQQNMVIIKPAFYQHQPQIN